MYEAGGMAAFKRRRQRAALIAWRSELSIDEAYEVSRCKRSARRTSIVILGNRNRSAIS